MEDERMDPLAGVDEERVAEAIYDAMHKPEHPRYPKLQGRVQEFYRNLGNHALAEVRRQLSEREGGK